MQHDLGPRAREGLGDVLCISDVERELFRVRPDLCQLVEGRRGRRPRREPGQLGAERLQPQGEPCALEARVACQQHAPAGPEIAIDAHSRRYLHAISEHGAQIPPLPPRAEVLGIPLAVSNYDEVLDWMEATISAGARAYMT